MPTKPGQDHSKVTALMDCYGLGLLLASIIDEHTPRTLELWSLTHARVVISDWKTDTTSTPSYTVGYLAPSRPLRPNHHEPGDSHTLDQFPGSCQPDHAAWLGSGWRRVDWCASSAQVDLTSPFGWRGLCHNPPKGVAA